MIGMSSDYDHTPFFCLASLYNAHARSSLTTDREVRDQQSHRKATGGPHITIPPPLPTETETQLLTDSNEYDTPRSAIIIAFSEQRGPLWVSDPPQHVQRTSPLLDWPNLSTIVKPVDHKDHNV